MKASCFLKLTFRSNKIQTLHLSIHLNTASNFYITHCLWSFEKRYKNDFGMYTLQHMAKFMIVSLAKISKDCSDICTKGIRFARNDLKC